MLLFHQRLRALAAVATLAFAATPALAAPSTDAAKSAQPTLFGIALNKAFDIAPCDSSVAGALQTVCAKPRASNLFDMAGEQSYEVVFRGAKQVPYLKYGSVIVSVREGVVKDVFAITNGAPVQTAVMADLAQHGTPAHDDKVDVSNAFGARYTKTHAIWHLDGGAVEFDGIFQTLDVGTLEAVAYDELAMRNPPAEPVSQAMNTRH
ncbi:MAG TPA: hypothetical protein VHL34_05135 [Rhizomicrobium sp.]|jgi:hypothetical protein|nr:hypothetical protein [Rhizomicrobium sp.]